MNAQLDEPQAMLLQNKTAIIYGGGGDVGAAVARAFADEGATVFLAGRTLAALNAVAKTVPRAEAAVLDALDKDAVEKHLATVVAKNGGVGEAFDIHAKSAGVTREAFEASTTAGIPLRRLPKVAEVANAAVLMASDKASAMTAMVANVTCGAMAD